MLETDEVDDDYFTPASTTTLASIFGGAKESKEDRESKETTNESLKYTPPKQHVSQNVTEEKLQEESKLTECIFACALSAYEWTDNNYLNRGKVGFAIIKIIKNNCHTIVLYNSNKTTLSSTTVNANLNMTLKGNNYICFYDSLSKYWSIYAKEEDVKRITEILTKLAVNMKYAVNTDHNPPDPNKTDIEKCDTVTCNSDKESDTDSSVNRRTKASILNRMATMGHSVLPPHTSPADKSSDSSDTNESTNQPPKITRPKPVKIINKRINADKNVSEILDLSNSSKTTVAKIEQPLPTTSMVYTCINGQLVPVSNTNISATYGNNSNSEMTLFMSEQRINNNELRININRTADKVDQILEKIKGLEQSEKDKSNSNFQTDIMQKLLSEYEQKIKLYEQLLTSKNVNNLDEHLLKTSSNTSGEIESYKIQISELQNIVNEKDKEIKMLNEKLQQNELVKEITNLKQSLAIKNDEFEKVVRQLDTNTKLKNNENDFENKLKYTMNDVYRSISVHFNNNETYTGENVKSVTASVIKDVTINFLREYNQE